MSEKTKIKWADSTINFWEGCTKVSAGCANCYAEARDRRFTGGKLWGNGKERRKSKSAVKDALALNRNPWICDECGEAFTPGDHECERKGGAAHRRRIFSLSLGDWLDPEVKIEWLAEMLDTIRRCDNVTWILCTKRPELWSLRMQAVLRTSLGIPTFVPSFYDWLGNWVGDNHTPSNIIILTSVENQEQADKRIPELLKIPAMCRGLSIEPLLGPVDLTRLCADESLGCTFNALTGLGDWSKDKQATPLQWLIVGGESGHSARPCNVEWIRSIVQQGKSAGVPVFVKQLGENAIRNLEPHEYHPNRPEGKAWPVITTDKKGGDPAEWPKDLRVREWPVLQ